MAIVKFLQRGGTLLVRSRKALAGLLPDLLMIGGAASVAYGASLVYAPAGHLVAGAFALAAGVLLSRGGR